MATVRRLIGNVKGPAGDAATVSVGTVTTGAPGTAAEVTNAGTSSAASFNFKIPKGAKGDAGAPGVTDYATTSAAGLVRIGADHNINSTNGTLSLKTAFTQASTLASLTSGEAWATMLGKLAKAVSTVVTIAGDYLKSTDIVDGLTSSLATKALSAKQGKALNDSITALNSSLTTLTKTGFYTYTYTLAAGASLAVTAENFGINGVSGYYAACVKKVTPGNANVIIRNFIAATSGTIVSLQNLGTSQVSNATVSLEILYIRNSALSG